MIGKITLTVNAIGAFEILVILGSPLVNNGLSAVM